MKSAAKSALKSKMLPALVVAAIMAVTAILPSCNAVGCTENRSSLPLTGFYAMESRKKLSLDSVDIGAVGAPDDSLLVKHGRAVTQLYLPLRPSATQTKYVFAYRWKDLDNPAIYDTITFDYEAYPFFSSIECGAMMQFHISRLTYTKHIIDSVAIIAPDSTITNIEKESIQVFFRTESPEDGDATAGRSHSDTSSTSYIFPSR